MQPNSYSYSYSQEQVELSPLLADRQPANFDLDLSCLAQTDEKLPAIIITPCRPTSPFDYEIAFLASKEDCGSVVWTLLQPLTSFVKLSHNSSRHARVAFCVVLPATVIGMHLLINRHLTGSVQSWSIPFWG